MRAQKFTLLIVDDSENDLFLLTRAFASRLHKLDRSEPGFGSEGKDAAKLLGTGLMTFGRHSIPIPAKTKSARNRNLNTVAVTLQRNRNQVMPK